MNPHTIGLILPSTHLLDGGYVDAELLVTAQTTHRIEVAGPTLGSYSHQRQAGHGYDLAPLCPGLGGGTGTLSSRVDQREVVAGHAPGENQLFPICRLARGRRLR